MVVMCRTAYYHAGSEVMFAWCQNLNTKPWSHMHLACRQAGARRPGVQRHCKGMFVVMRWAAEDQTADDFSKVFEDSKLV